MVSWLGTTGEPGGVWPSGAEGALNSVPRRDKVGAGLREVYLAALCRLDGEPESGSWEMSSLGNAVAWADARKAQVARPWAGKREVYGRGAFGEGDGIVPLAAGRQAWRDAELGVRLGGQWMVENDMAEGEGEGLLSLTRSVSYELNFAWSVLHG